MASIEEQKKEHQGFDANQSHNDPLRRHNASAHANCGKYFQARRDAGYNKSMEDQMRRTKLYSCNPSTEREQLDERNE